MKKQPENQIVRDSVHYLKTSFSSLQVLYETAFVIETNSNPKTKKIKNLIEKQIKEVNFRIELFTNFLLRDTEPKKLQIEFFQIAPLLEKAFQNTTLKYKDISNKEEILTDKQVLTLIFTYLNRLTKTKIPLTKRNLIISKNEKSNSLFFVLEIEKKIDLNKDKILETELIKKLLLSLTKWLQGSFETSAEENTEIYSVFLPRKFTP